MSYSETCANGKPYLKTSVDGRRCSSKCANGYHYDGESCVKVRGGRSSSRSRSGSRSRSSSRSRSLSRSRYLPPYYPVGQRKPLPMSGVAPPMEASFEVRADRANDNAKAPTAPVEGFVSGILNSIVKWFTSTDAKKEFTPDMASIMRRPLAELTDWYDTEYLKGTMIEKIGLINTIYFLLVYRNLTPDLNRRRELNDQLITNFLAFDKLYQEKPRETSAIFSGRANTIALYKYMIKFINNVVMPNNNLIVYMTGTSDIEAAKKIMRAMWERLNLYVAYT